MAHKEHSPTSVDATKISPRPDDGQTPMNERTMDLALDCRDYYGDNDLAADVAGANGVGMISVWLNWAPRRRKTPAGDLEIPRYTVEEPLALLGLLDELEHELANQRREP